MQPVLPLFSSVEQKFEPIGTGVPARCSTGSPHGIAYFNLAPLEGVLPDCYLEDVDCDERVVVPGDTALVVYANRSAIGAREMVWGSAPTRTTSLLGAAWRHDVLPRIGSRNHEQRAVVIVNRIGLRSAACDREAEIWISSTQPRPIYAAALWSATPRGPEFTVLQQRSTGPEKQVSPVMPVLVDDANIWEWLNGRQLLVPPRISAKRGQFSVSVAAKLAQW